MYSNDKNCRVFFSTEHNEKYEMITLWFYCVSILQVNSVHNGPLDICTVIYSVANETMRR